MKPGDDYQCPQCKKETFLKKESVMDGWTKKGDVLKCASCGHVACELSEKTNSETHSSDPLKSFSLITRLNIVFDCKERL